MQNFMYGATAARGWKEGKWGPGSTLATVMFFWMTICQLFPHLLYDLPLRRWAEKLAAYFYPYVEISFPEHVGDRLAFSPAFPVIETYLSTACSDAARRLRAELVENYSTVVLALDEDQELVDRFEGVSFWWQRHVTGIKPLSFFSAPKEKRSYRLTFHRRHRRLVEEKYLRFVMQKGQEIAAGRRQRWLFTNVSSPDVHLERLWTHVPFYHPATFETLAMDPEKKEALIKDLESFRKRKDYYARVGKAWKRGYLLYGPPGTGKSSLIAAMANFLEYDVYNLELTAVRDNSALRRLLIETREKSIIVVEDIDCSLELAGKRTAAEVQMEYMMTGRQSQESRVTLSGLLNSIDGLWSVCGGERIIVFTTNYLEKLDPALIRRGRMDVHLELSYCRFEGFKVLAKNYLGIEEHELFDRVRGLIEEVDITPADVAEVLMAGSHGGGREEECLQALVRTLNEKLIVVAEVPAEPRNADELKS